MRPPGASREPSGLDFAVRDSLFSQARALRKAAHCACIASQVLPAPVFVVFAWHWRIGAVDGNMLMLLFLLTALSLTRPYRMAGTQRLGCA